MTFDVFQNKMKRITMLFVLLSATFFVLTKQSAPEQGKFDFSLRVHEMIYERKSLDDASTIDITVSANKDHGCTATSPLNLKVVIQGLTCFGKYSSLSNMTLPWISSHPDTCPLTDSAVKGAFLESDTTFRCSDAVSHVVHNKWNFFSCSKPESPTAAPASTSASRRKRAKENINPPIQSNQSALNAPSENVPKNPNSENKTTGLVTPFKGDYLIILSLDGKEDSQVSVSVEAKGSHEYLSPQDYPLLIFYMIMCIVYALYGFVWLVMSACNYRDLLRIQLWVGGVIFLGMVEKAVFYSEYLSVESTGMSVAGAAKFAEIVSALKRSVARMLVIIVSLGFGIVKPRLGPMLHRVIGVGILYFILAIIEAMVRNDASLHEPDNKALLFTYIPVAVLDSIICWWVFMSLLQTMKTLRLRRNTTKLSLYRHFSNLIIFCVLSSIVMILWSVKLHNSDCISDWSELWVDTAFWHILFSVILLVIMILWRPNANNQRYAYSPMIDGNDSDLEELEEAMLGSGATEGMKLRGATKKDGDGDVNKTEEDLKWIEENIPQTIADAALPALLDSDEEVMTTKYEMSKME